MGGFFAIFIIMFVIATGVIICSWVYGINNYRSTIKRAQKIDPSVKTLSEADYVLKKDIAESVGKDTVNTEEDKKYCKHCGAEIDADSKFCNHCGQEQ